jgi:hypothetical protein
VDGERLELSTEQLKDQSRFHTVCMEVINKWPRQIKPNEWATLVRQKLEHVEEVEVPPDARPDGQMSSTCRPTPPARPRPRRATSC